MKEQTINISGHYLFPSAIFVTEKDYLVTTVLGSCVAVCLHDKVRKVGGINHYMLPLWNGKGLASPKFGNIAIEQLITKMLKSGSKKENLIAKLFGGANQSNSTMRIGERNVELAIDLLQKNNIDIVARSTGGFVGRKIIFNTATGQVRMKYVDK